MLWLLGPSSSARRRLPIIAPASSPELISLRPRWPRCLLPVASISCRPSRGGSSTTSSSNSSERTKVQAAVPLHTAAAAEQESLAADVPPVVATVVESESADQLPQLDGPMQRRVATLMAAQFLLSCGYGCIAPVLPALAVQLGVGSTGAGALLSAPAITRLLLNLPAGRMADNPKIGRSPLMVGGCAIMTVACAGSYSTESVEVLLATRLAFGAGSAFAVAGTAAYIPDHTGLPCAADGCADHHGEPRLGRWAAGCWLRGDDVRQPVLRLCAGLWLRSGMHRIACHRASNASASGRSVNI